MIKKKKDRMPFHRALPCFYRLSARQRSGGSVIFFFQAEDGIRDFHVTGVQTCALPISVIWAGLTDQRGIAGRDAIWSHPDLLPTADDFDDPDGYVRGRPEIDISDFEEPAPDKDDGDGSAAPGGPE